MEFKRFIDPQFIRQKLLEENYHMWVCFVGDEIVGILATRPVCHICLLFVDGRHHRKGIARSLFDTMTEFFELNEEFTEITVYSSPFATEVYHKLGFVDTNTEQVINGIRFTPMKRER